MATIDDPNLTERITLEWERWVTTHHASAPLLREIKFDALPANRATDPILDHLFGSLLLRLEKALLTHTFARDTYSADLRVPATWWDMFKAEHSGRWWMPWSWVARHPVEYRTRTARIHVRRMHTYPQSQLARHPEMGNSVIVELAGAPVWDHE